MKLKNNPEVYYLEDGCYKWTFDAKKVKKVVENNCKGDVINLFAGKNKLHLPNLPEETRVDVSDEFRPDFNIKAEHFIKFALKNNIRCDTIVYDPPWNERKSKEFYEGHYIGKFTKLKNNLIKILNPKGIIISVGYEISNFGKNRMMTVDKLYVVNPFGEIRPYFISIEGLVKTPDIREWLE